MQESHSTLMSIPEFVEYLQHNYFIYLLKIKDRKEIEAKIRLDLAPMVEKYAKENNISSYSYTFFLKDSVGGASISSWREEVGGFLTSWEYSISKELSAYFTNLNFINDIIDSVLENKSFSASHSITADSLFGGHEKKNFTAQDQKEITDSPLFMLLGLSLVFVDHEKVVISLDLNNKGRFHKIIQNKIDKMMTDLETELKEKNYYAAQGFHLSAMRQHQEVKLAIVLSKEHPEMIKNFNGLRFIYEEKSNWVKLVPPLPTV